MSNDYLKKRLENLQREREYQIRQFQEEENKLKRKIENEKLN